MKTLIHGFEDERWQNEENAKILGTVYKFENSRVSSRV